LSSCVFVVLLATLACAPRSDDAAARATAEGLLADYARAKNAGDAAAITALFTNDAVWIVENAPALSGSEAIGAMYRPWFEAERIEFAATVTAAHAVGARTAARGGWTMTSTPKAGGNGRSSGGGWVGLLRQDESRWRFEWLMASSDRPERGRTADGADERALVQLEKDWVAALAKADTKALEGILAPHWVASSEGSPLSRPQLLAALRTGAARFEIAEGSEEEAFVFGDTAVVHGLVRLKGTSGGKPFDGKSRYTDLFVRRDGRWQAVGTASIPVQ
jgi:uncharacterized protein (TIGR02246 family)